MSDLAKSITSITPDKREQLQLLLLWSYNNLQPDADRFFNGGIPLSNSETFRKRIGLCDEFSNVVQEFCGIVGISSIKIPGYVKYQNFQAGEPFTESNHAWNAVFLNQSWLLCDLFWSVTALENDRNSEPHFISRLETEYFLGIPSAFINDHFPSDPVFQFDNYPMAIKSFTNKSTGLDLAIPRMSYLNYVDSLKVLTKMNADNRSLRIANHAYSYNENNPNELIGEYFNHAVSIINKAASTKTELKSAKACLTSALSLIALSKNEDIKSLTENCEEGISRIDKRLASLP